MKNKLILLCTVFLIILSKSLYSYTNLKMFFHKGETLIYDIEILNIKVAEQKTIIKDILTIKNKKYYYIYTDVHTISPVNKIYHLNDIIETLVDVDAFLPILIRTKISEGNWNNIIIITIDDKKKKAVFKYKNKLKIIKFKDYCFDFISLLYYFRSIIPRENEKINFSIHNKSKLQDVTSEIKYINKEEYIPVLKKHVKVLEFQNLDKDKAELWLTNDESRIPYKIIPLEIKVASYGVIKMICILSYYNKGE